MLGPFTSLPWKYRQVKIQACAACEALGDQKGDDAASNTGTGPGVLRATGLEGPGTQEGMWEAGGASSNHGRGSNTNQEQKPGRTSIHSKGK